MTGTKTFPPEESLDPQDRGRSRTGYRMVDDMMDTLENIRERPAWQRTQPVKDHFKHPRWNFPS